MVRFARRGIRRFGYFRTTKRVVVGGIDSDGSVRIGGCYAQDAVRATRQWRQAHERELVQNYIELLRMPNITHDLPNLRRAADALMTEMTKRGLSPKLLTLPDVAFVVYGEMSSPGASRDYGDPSRLHLRLPAARAGKVS